MPGRFMAASMRCIQFSPVIRTSSRTKASRPQNVTKTFVLTPLAAAVDDRMRTGQMRSRSPLQLTITSSLTAAAPDVSRSLSNLGCASCAPGGDGGPIVWIMALTSALSHHEAVFGAIRAGLDQCVARRARPRRKVFDRPGVRGEDLEDLA